MKKKNSADPRADLKIYTTTQRKLIDQALNGFLPRGSIRPKTLHKSMKIWEHIWAKFLSMNILVIYIFGSYLVYLGIYGNYASIFRLKTYL